MFIDKIKIYVKGGDGGNGCIAFRRESYKPLGGPAGGDGGKGGDVILRVNPKMHTLLDLYYKRHFKAERGRNGEGKNRDGRNGKNLIVEVPPGTLVVDKESGEVIMDLIEGNYIVAHGGRGGRGNAFFTTPQNQAPEICEEGKPGEERWIILELRLIADVGLVGLPNAGKSTLLSRLTRANPKIASYPFTTKYPGLGIAELSEYRRIVLADIPGIIEGAHLGKGMGLEFLRHISRTKILIFLLDILDNPIDAYATLLEELREYNPELLRRPGIIALNKIDAASDKLLKKNWINIYTGKKIFLISAATGSGLKELLNYLYKLLSREEITNARIDVS